MDPVASTLGQVQGSRATAPPEAFGRAIEEFLDELKQKHREDAKNPFLQALTSYVGTTRTENGLSQSEISAGELQNSILELDARKRTGKGYRLVHRLSPFLEILRSVLKKFETLVEVAPFGVAVAFVGARIVLEMALAVEEYLDIVVTAMERIAGILEVYQRLSSSPDLGSRIIRSYKGIITFWYKLSKVLSSSKAKGILPRAVLTPLKKETEEALRNLQEDMQVNLGISQAAGLIMANIDRQERADANQKALKSDIRRWIMGQNYVDFKGDYEIQLDLRHEDTCAWVLQDERFLNWHDSRNNALLWYNAPPGCGKSVLASAVIDYLARGEKKVAYFFYSFSKSSSRHVADGLRILALQLLAFVQTPSDKLVDLYETETQFSPYLNNTRAMASVVYELITRNDDLYIVIDGIDECEDEKDMAHVIQWLIDQPTLGTARWLFTSRVSEIEKTMRRLQAVEMNPSPEDIREDIKRYLSSKISCEDCLRDWADECDDNFLIARFVSETLGKLTSEADIRAELGRFPKKLNGYYTRTLVKINARGRMEQIVARRIFIILSSAQQAVSIDELVDALAIQRGSQDYSALRLPKEELIRDLCGSLIIVEQHASEPDRSPLVKFCHKSVKDFFQQDPNTHDLGVDESLLQYFVTPSDAHEEIGLDCLTYLMYNRYSKHLDLGFLAGIIPKEHAFLRYAATFWFQHLGDNSIETPSSAAEQAVQEFISSKNFWNCMRVQSHVVPYLFGRYTSHKRRFRMAISGREWKGDDRFAVPLPTWLGDHSPENLLRDQSLCYFAEEWREVIIRHPDGLDQCVPTKSFASSCWLKSLSKSNVVRSVNLVEAFGSDIVTSSRLLGVGFSGKKLYVDVAYQTKDGPRDTVYRLKQPLFKANSQPQKWHQRLPMDSDGLEWVIRPIAKEDATCELIAWSVDPLNLDLKKTGGKCSERISMPMKTARTASKTSWEMIAHYDELKADVGTSIQVIHMSRKSSRPTALDHDYDDDDADDEDDSDDENHNYDSKKPSGAVSDAEESDYEEEFSDDDTSSLPILDKTVDALTIAMVESNLKKGTETSIQVLGLAGDQEDVLAITQELRFSRCGSYLHCLAITFLQKNFYTECSVTTSCLEFTLEEGDTTKTITASKMHHAVYNLVDPLFAIDPPFSLSYWCDDYIIVALPPITCSPKILKISLKDNVSDPILTLRNALYFPASTPRRDPHLVYRPSSKDTEAYLFLVLNAVPAPQDAVSDTSSPVAALRWGVSDDDGWRPWNQDDESLPDPTRKSPLWNLMRGNFVESGKPFSVPVRCGLNWTRKGYLSCA
ncbi:hypothetical protein ONZ43_g5162 [Nemania bipapillata]|uniref:Uncharacterized protein n=1 Tax=Nemania bipapillata TaxID=110536 RepID=A0ACC2IDX8_9PEZI|nr:hypothetical protein ONZ43_g5162 [Nemania bipapillata]